MWIETVINVEHSLEMDFGHSPLSTLADSNRSSFALNCGVLPPARDFRIVFCGWHDLWSKCHTVDRVSVPSRTVAHHPCNLRAISSETSIGADPASEMCRCCCCVKKSYTLSIHKYKMLFMPDGQVAAKKMHKIVHLLDKISFAIFGVCLFPFRWQWSQAVVLFGLLLQEVHRRHGETVGWRMIKVFWWRIWNCSK